MFKAETNCITAKANLDALITDPRISIDQFISFHPVGVKSGYKQEMIINRITEIGSILIVGLSIQQFGGAS